MIEEKPSGFFDFAPIGNMKDVVFKRFAQDDRFFNSIVLFSAFYCSFLLQLAIAAGFMSKPSRADERNAVPGTVMQRTP